MTSFRSKLGPFFVSLVIAFIALVFVFAGVFSPSPTGGSGSAAGTVNGEIITLSEFNREYERRMEFFKNLGGGQLTEEQIKMFRIRESVLNELVNRKLLQQAAEDEGLIASDKEVREQIMQIPAFQKDGRFDTQSYKAVLQANQMTPASFEKALRGDLTLQKWNDYFKNRVQVSEEEARREYELNEEKRKLKYVLLPIQASAPAQAEEPKKGEAPTASPAAQSFQVDRALAEKVAEAMNSSSDAKVKALLKDGKSELKTTEWITASQEVIPGLGEAKALRAAIFSKTPSKKAEIYEVPAGLVVARVMDLESADMKKFEKEREKVMAQVTFQKQQKLYEEFVEQLRKKATIKTNESLLGTT